jgi:drug/metabolite transporter (DMT)-like permease
MADMILALTFALSAAFCFGISKFLIKKASNVNPLVSVLYTFLLAPPILFAFAFVDGDLFVSYNLSLSTVVDLALAGLFYLGVGRVFAYASINLVGAARASQLTSTQIIFSAILSVLFLQEGMNIALALGTAVIFCGLILISLSKPKENGKELIPTSKFKRGVALGLVGGILWGASQLFLKAGVRGINSSVMANLISYGFAIVIQGALVLSLAREEFRRGKTQTAYLLLAGLVSTLAFLAQSSALRIAPVVWTNPIVNASPLVTLLVSYLLLQKVEFINKRVVAGAFAVVIGIALIIIAVPQM